MNLDQDLVLAYLEEDNIQRAYFRVRPLMTIQGDVQEEAKKLWPDEGCLRIVPDRAEQHTFKDRMRTLGSYCVVDLRGIPTDAGKIRTNKNYRPEKGELNQYILYSDTVKALEEHTFFEVLEGNAQAASALAEKAITPAFYIRSEDALFGPVRKCEPVVPNPAQEASATLFTLNAPDGVTHLMLCMSTPVEAVNPEPEEVLPVAEAKEEATTQPDDAPLPLGQKLNILDETKSFDETLQQLSKPLSKEANLLHASPAKAAQPVLQPQTGALSGTPLIHAHVKTSVPQPKNKLQEVVANQLRVARYEPPTAPLPVGASMRQVDNPVETACTSLRCAWKYPEAQGQLMDFILSLDGMRLKLENKLSSCEDSPLRKAMLGQLYDLEAERLAALVQLDKAKADLENFRKTSLAALSERSRKECDQLTASKTEMEKGIEGLRKQITMLSEERNQIQSLVDDLQQSILPSALAKAMTEHQMNMPVNGIPLRMNCTAGSLVSADDLISRVMNVMAETGASFTRNEAVALLLLLATSKRIGIASAVPAVAATMLSNVALALGWKESYAQQVSPEQRPLPVFAPADSTPALLATSLSNYAPLPGVTKLLLARAASHLTRNPAYEMQSWPIMPLGGNRTVSSASKAGTPVSAASLRKILDVTGASREQIEKALSGISAVLPPLSGHADQELQSFVASASALMVGGLAAACDWAILMWYLPGVERNQRNVSMLKPLLQEYPMSLAKLMS